MTSRAVTAAFKEAGRERTRSSKLWDALMYRTSVVRSDLSVNDVSLILNSFAKFPKYLSPPFVRYLLEPLSGNCPQVSLTDVSMILKNAERLKIMKSEAEKAQFFESLRPLIESKLQNTVSTNDLVNLVSTLGRYPLDAALSKRIEGIVANLDMEKIREPKPVLILLAFILRSSSHLPVFPEEEDEQEEPFESTSASLEKNSEVQLLLLSRLLQRAVVLSARFNHRDSFMFSKIVSSLDPPTLNRLGYPSVQPLATLTTRMIVRDLSKFKPHELVQLMLQACILDKAKLSEECIYRMRDLRPLNAIKILISAPPHEKLTEAVQARLCKYDAPRDLTPTDLLGFTQRLLLLGHPISSHLEDSLFRPVMKKSNSEQLVALFNQIRDSKKPS
jgi:hypothetical protein